MLNGNNGIGRPIGILLRNVDAKDLKERMKNGEPLFVRGKPKDK